MNEENLIKYYNKFNEDKRLDTRHGQVEFITSITYINKFIKKNDKIIDIGAGTGKYSKYYMDKGYDVFAVELVKHNLRKIEEKNIKCMQGNAINLSKIKDNSYDIVLLFGPMYHLLNDDDKLKALSEAKRIVKKNGYIFISYCTNEFAIIKYGFIDGKILDSIENNLINKDYKIKNDKDNLYSFVRLEDINYYKDKLNLKRVKILSQDGPSEYMRKVLNKMSEKEFDIFIDYHLKTCEREELLGSGRHILDILTK